MRRQVTTLVLVTCLAIATWVGVADATGTSRGADLTAVPGASTVRRDGNDDLRLTTSVRVSNTGAVAARSSATRVVLSRDRIADARDRVLVNQAATRPIAARRSLSVPVSVLLPESTASGSWYLVACADTRAVVRETNERNQCAASARTLVVPSRDDDGDGDDGGESSTTSAPAFIASTPSGTSSNPLPLFVGTAEAGAVVYIHASATCADVPLTQATAGFDGTFAVTVPVPRNTRSVLHATAKVGTRATSTCSISAIAYTHDDLAPDTPTTASYSPASPSTATLVPSSVMLSVQSTPGALLRTWTGGSCSGTQVDVRIVPSNGIVDIIGLSVAANATTTFSFAATDGAGNVSSCGTSSYLHDAAPAAPTALATTTASPSLVRSTTLTGHEEANATIVVYAQSGCAGTNIGTTTADGTGSWSFPVVANLDATTRYSARARDATSSSLCSSSVEFVHERASRFDIVMPAGPHVVGPIALTVRALTAHGLVDTTYDGTVHITSNDPFAALPADYVFAPGDAGVHAFGGVAFTVVGSSRRVTVADATRGITTTGSTFDVVVGAADHTVVVLPGQVARVGGAGPVAPVGAATRQVVNTDFVVDAYVTDVFGNVADHDGIGVVDDDCGGCVATGLITFVDGVAHIEHVHAALPGAIQLAVEVPLLNATFSAFDVDP